MRSACRFVVLVFAGVLAVFLMSAICSADDSSLPLIPVDVEVVTSGKTGNYSYELYSDGLFYMVGFCEEGGDSNIKFSDLDDSLLKQIEYIYFDVSDSDVTLNIYGDPDCEPTDISFYSRSSKGFWNLSFENFPTVGSVSFPNDVNAFRLFFTNVGIKSVDKYSDKVTNRLYIKDCNNIKGIKLDSSLENLAVINCPNLWDVDISGSKIETYNFTNCSGLYRVLLPKTNKTIYPNSFKGSTTITDLTIPDCVSKISNNAFTKCGITDIKIPSGVEIIEDKAFENCFKLRNIYISSNTVQIAENAFTGCSALKNVSFAGTREEFEKIRVVRYQSSGYVDSDMSIDDVFDGVTIRYNVKTGWIKEDGQWCYRNLVGERVREWNEIGQSWYYFDSDGFMVTGWRQIKFGWYFFDASGKMVTGWKQIDGNWYCFTEYGVMLKGWQKINYVWYYLGENGAMAVGWKKIDGEWYNFDSVGRMATGWKCVNGAWYLFSQNGKMITGWKQFNGSWFYLDLSGVMATGWKNVGADWYYFESSGAMVTGWKKINSDWYYFDLTGAMVTGWKKISGNWYYFKNTGVMAAGEYCEGYWINPDGTWTYKDVATWHQDSNGWWFGDTTGWYAKSRSLTINGKSYNFDSNGYCTNP